MHTNTANNLKLIYPELSYAITGACFSVHNALGRYSKEKQYSDALEQMFKEKSIDYEREFLAKGTGNIIDFFIDDKIVLEVKAKPTITKQDYYQTQRYLHALNAKLGLLCNFRNTFLKPLRVLKTEALYL